MVIRFVTTGHLKNSCDVIEHRIMQSIPDWIMQKLIFMKTASKHTFVDVIIEIIVFIACQVPLM